MKNSSKFWGENSKKFRMEINWELITINKILGPGKDSHQLERRGKVKRLAFPCGQRKGKVRSKDLTHIIRHRGAPCCG
jgi:hypothetical protein